MPCLGTGLSPRIGGFMVGRGAVLQGLMEEREERLREEGGRDLGKIQGKGREERSLMESRLRQQACYRAKAGVATPFGKNVLEKGKR